MCRSIGTFARALLDGAKKPQISLRLGAAAASRDITLFHAMDTLNQNDYDITQATSCLVPRGPVLCADELEAWTQGSCGGRGHRERGEGGERVRIEREGRREGKRERGKGGRRRGERDDDDNYHSLLHCVYLQRRLRGLRMAFKSRRISSQSNENT